MNSGPGAVEGAWRRHRQWSRAANQARARVDRWRTINLSLLVVGAVLGAIAAQPDWPRAVTVAAAGAAAVALAVAGVVQQRFLNPTEVARWTGARTASESLKAEVYRYLAGVAPYSGPDRDERLAARIEAVQTQANSLLRDMQRFPTDERPLPPVEDLSSYITHRARQQAEWHRSGIAGHERAAQRLRGAELIATLLAAVLAALGVAFATASLATWIGVATTIGGALAAHANATQHERVVATYAATADRLGQLVEQLGPHPDPMAAAQFVIAVETRLADQNESWSSLFSTSGPSS